MDVKKHDGPQADDGALVKDEGCGTDKNDDENNDRELSLKCHAISLFLTKSLMVITVARLNLWS